MPGAPKINEDSSVFMDEATENSGSFGGLGISRW